MLWPRKGSLMKTQTRILDNRLYYIRKIELQRKGKKSRTVRITLICGICCTPQRTGKCNPRPFFRWVRAQGRSPHAPGIPKNAYGPVGIPLIRGASGTGRLTQPPNGGKSLRPKEISRYRDTLGQIRAADNTAGRSATRQLERFRPILICGICWPPHPTGKCGTRPFLWWVRAQGRSPHAPGIWQKCIRPRRHSPY